MKRSRSGSVLKNHKTARIKKQRTGLKQYCYKKPITPRLGSDNDSDMSDSDSEYSEGSNRGDFSFFSNCQVSSRNNKIFFRGKVSESSVDKLISILDEKNERFEELMKENDFIRDATPTPLYLHITSYGGCLLSGFRAVDAIMKSKIPVYTVIDGHAASAATLMSVVGKKRYMTKNSWALIHQLSSGSGGTYWNIKDSYENVTDLMERIYDIYENSTKMTRDEIKDYLKHDRWWSSAKCQETGIVDDIE